MLTVLNRFFHYTLKAFVYNIVNGNKFMVTKDTKLLENIISIILLGIIVSSGAVLAIFLFLSPTIQ